MKISGGAMLGHCAPGKVTTAVPRRTRVRIAITIATIGRFMKNLDMALLSLRSVIRRGIYHLSVADFFHPKSHDPLSRVQTRRDHPERASGASYLNISDLCPIIGTKHNNLIASLHLIHGLLWHQQCLSQNLRERTNLRILSWSQDILWIREFAYDLNCSRLCVDLTIRENDLAWIRIGGAVGQDQLQRNPRGVRQPIDSTGSGAIRHPQVFLFADREIRLDWVHLRHRGEDRRRPDEVTHLHRGDTGDAVN